MSTHIQFTEVFESGKPYEVLMVQNALAEQGIPFISQELSSSGMVTAMPASPVPAPGITWIVRVPTNAEADARAVIDSLPVQFDENPGAWHFNPEPGVKKLWRWYLLAFLILMAVSVLSNVVGWIF